MSRRKPHGNKTYSGIMLVMCCILLLFLIALIVGMASNQWPVPS